MLKHRPSSPSQTRVPSAKQTNGFRRHLSQREAGYWTAQLVFVVCCSVCCQSRIHNAARQPPSEPKKSLENRLRHIHRAPVLSSESSRAHFHTTRVQNTSTIGNCPSLLVQPSNRRGIGIETPMPPCAFKMSMLNVSAIRIKSRSWLRSSSTHEPSDPPLGIVLFQSRQM